MNKTAVFSELWKYLIIIILIITVYFPTFSGDFIFDDRALVSNNPFIKESHSITEYFYQEDGIVDKNDLGNYHSGYYRPIINMTYRLDYKLWGMDASGFRITNLILHILYCLILYAFISRLIDRQIAFWSTLIFALHPVNTESVSIITSRNNIIAALFILGSLWFYITGWERNKIVAYIVSLFLFAGAVFSKEFGIMTIPLIFLYHRVLSTQNSRLSKEAISYIPFVMIAIFYLIMRKGVTDSILTPSDMENIWSRIYFTPFIIFYNLKLIFLPHGLHVIYLKYPLNIFNWYSTASFILFFSFCLALGKIIQKRLLLFSILAFLVCLFPAVNIIPNSSISLIGMRWLYVSMGFLLICIGLAIKKIIVIKKGMVLSILGAILIYLGGYTYVLNQGLWHDDDTFIRQEAITFNNKLFASDMAERYLNNRQYREAESYFKIAIKEFPYQAYSYINLSALYLETERPGDAVSLLNQARPLIMTYHEQGEWHNNMGMALFKLGDKEKGLTHLRQAVISAPDEPLFWANLGGLYGVTGDYDNSINALKSGIEVTTESIKLKINLALTYINLKDYKEAISILEGLSEKEKNENAEVLRILNLARMGHQNNVSDLDSAYP